MRILSLVLVGLYAALNLFLAVAGMFVMDSPEPKSQRVIPCLTFLAAAALLAAAVALRNTPLLIVGLIVASVAPFLFGLMVEHSNVLLHHAIRAVAAVGLAVLWIVAQPHSH